MPEIKKKSYNSPLPVKQEERCTEEHFLSKTGQKRTSLQLKGSDFRLQAQIYFIFLRKTNLLFMPTHSESHKLPAPLLYAALAFTLAVLLFSAYLEDSLFSLSFFIGSGFSLLLFGSLLAAKLRLTFYDKGIRYHFTPFHWQTHEIRWEEVEEAKLIHFNALAAYGGWGIRYNFFTKTKAFVTQGGSGLLIVTRQGRRRLFSIQQPARVQPFISTFLNGPEAKQRA